MELLRHVGFQERKILGLGGMHWLGRLCHVERATEDRATNREEDQLPHSPTGAWKYSDLKIPTPTRTFGPVMWPIPKPDGLGSEPTQAELEGRRVVYEAMKVDPWASDELLPLYSHEPTDK
jgi:hypothetical protein